MTDQKPKLLLDTCAIINLSYCAPVASVFRLRYEGTAGWVRATQAELVRQRSRRPPHPQAGRAGNWAAMWLGVPIELVDEQLLLATENIQRNIAAGSTDSALDHLGLPEDGPYVTNVRCARMAQTRADRVRRRGQRKSRRTLVT